MCRILLVASLVLSLLPSSADEFFKRIPIESATHPALISDLGDPTSGQPYTPSNLWWPEKDVLVQGYGDSRLSFSLWDPKTRRRLEDLHSESSATLSCDGKYVAMTVYDKEAKKSYVRLYTFPEGKLQWSESLGVGGFFFPKGCSWFVGGSAQRLKNVTRYRVVKIDLANGTVLKEWTLEEPRVSGKRHYGRLNALGASSDSIYVSTKQESFAFDLPEEDRQKMTSVRFLRLDAEELKKQSVPFDYRKAEAVNVQVSPNGKHVALRYLHYTEILTADLTKSLGGNSSSGRVAFSPDGREVVIPGRDSILIQSLVDETDSRWLDFGAKGAAYSPDGNVAAFCDKGGVFLYSTQTWEPVEAFDPHRACCPPRDVLVDPRGNYMAVLDGRSVHLWDLQRLALSYSLVSPRARDSCFHGLALVRDGSSILASDGREVLRWDLPESAFQVAHPAPRVLTGKPFVEGQAEEEICHCTEVAHAGSMKQIVMRWGDGFRLYQDGQMSPLQLIDARLPGTLEWALRPKTNDLVYVGRRADGRTLNAYDLGTGKTKPRWKNGPNSTNFSPDGSQIVDVDGATIRLYDVERRAEAQTIEVPAKEGDRVTLHCPTWSPNGRLLAVVVHHQVTLDGDFEHSQRLALWDMRLRKLLGAVTIPTHVRATKLAFTPSNDKIIGVHPNKSLMLWDARKIVSLGDKTP